jgi:ribosomal protein L37AE/L43A
MAVLSDRLLCPICGRLMSEERAEEIGICQRCEKEKKEEVWHQIVKRKVEDGEREE